MKQPVELIKDDKIREEFTSYLNAKTAEEKSRIVKNYNERFAQLSAEEQAEETAALMENLRGVVSGVRENLEELDGAILRKKLGEVPQAISLSYIAAQCGKSKSWLSQRLNGNIVNNKEARFTTSEVRLFQDALHDLGRKLLSVSLI
ncbi:MAG: DUF5053 domain-containing protein [Prevotella sp.]|nr:DUF5053 domain-containing protein [Prevotella sp.]